MIHDLMFEYLLGFALMVGLITISTYLCQLDRLVRSPVMRGWVFMLLAATLLLFSRFVHRRDSILADLLNDWWLSIALSIWSLAGLWALHRAREPIMTSSVGPRLRWLRRCACPFGGHCWIGAAAVAMIGSGALIWLF